MGKSHGGSKQAITAQVADVTKPLAAGGEIVDGGSWIILNKKGGAIVKLDSESKKEIEEIVKRQANHPVPIKREKGTFYLEIFMDKKGGMSATKEEDQGWKKVHKGIKQKAIPMEVDKVDNKNYWEAFLSEESNIFHRPE